MDHTLDDDTPRHCRGATRLMDRFIAYVGSRSGEHWIMFVAGLVVGLILG
jgi:hypothetical protein